MSNLAKGILVKATFCDLTVLLYSTKQIIVCTQNLILRCYKVQHFDGWHTALFFFCNVGPTGSQDAYKLFYLESYKNKGCCWVFSGRWGIPRGIPGGPYRRGKNLSPSDANANIPNEQNEPVMQRERHVAPCSSSTCSCILEMMQQCLPAHWSCLASQTRLC